MKDVNSLLGRSVTRKEFLQLLGLGALAVFGINNLLSLLFKEHAKTTTATQRSAAPSGFGSRKFGA